MPLCSQLEDRDDANDSKWKSMEKDETFSLESTSLGLQALTSQCSARYRETEAQSGELENSGPTHWAVSLPLVDMQCSLQKTSIHWHRERQLRGHCRLARTGETVQLWATFIPYWFVCTCVTGTWLVPDLVTTAAVQCCPCNAGYENKWPLCIYRVGTCPRLTPDLEASPGRMRS